MAFTMMHFIQLHHRLFFFNDICFRPVKIAKRFSIVNNCWQKKKHENKRTGSKKQVGKNKLDAKLNKTEKNQILNCS